MPPPNGGRAAHYPSLMVCGADKGGGPNQSRCRELLGQAGTQGEGGAMALVPRLERRAVPQGWGVREA